MDTIQIIALVIFIITYLGIIFTRLPGVNIDRPSAAFSGAIAMVLFGIFTPEEAIEAIDFNTIFLLLGMMIIIASLQIDGFFTFIANKTISYSRTRFRLLTLIVLVTGITSAFLVNDAVVLMFTPVIIQICCSSKINPMPYLIAEILSSNIGSVMTITGNPQNMLIGISSGISYTQFLVHLLPISLLGMGIVILIVRLFYRKEFRQKEPLVFAKTETFDIKRLSRSVIVFGIVVIGFFLGKLFGLSIPLVALTGAALIMLIGEAKPSKVIQKVDWVLLLFFASLFIVVGAVEKAGFFDSVLKSEILSADLKGLGIIHGLSLVLSQIVSNVPFAVLMLPMLKAAGSNMLWMSLASASTLAGNATIIGAMANLIVIESADKQGYHISFMEFFKIGIIVTMITLPLSLGLLYAQYAFGWIA
ncbi:MAG: anion transporter [Bacteroidales bacterium]|nr:anion transporter [Bacteroidales bacterium]MDD3907326.1 anion transporter [Bacteroidales bacterium]MDD4712837.1 anion transporter [Bacteroidales bacterium]